MMAATGQRIADHEQQIADLTAQVEQLEQHITAQQQLEQLLADLQARAFVVGTFNEMRLDHLGSGTGGHAGLKPSRPLHLTAVQGGRR